MSKVWCIYRVISLFYCSCFFFFFKQKTAYEIVSRDWSSDVCSSDLRRSDTTAPPSVGSPASMTPPGTPTRPESPPPPVATLSDADSPIVLRRGGRRRVLMAETSSDEGRHSSEDEAPRQPKRPRSSRTAEARREKQRQKHPLRPPCHCKTLCWIWDNAWVNTMEENKLHLCQFSTILLW